VGIIAFPPGCDSFLYGFFFLPPLQILPEWTSPFNKSLPPEPLRQKIAPRCAIFLSPPLLRDITSFPFPSSVSPPPSKGFFTSLSTVIRSPIPKHFFRGEQLLSNWKWKLFLPTKGSSPPKFFLGALLPRSNYPPPQGGSEE